MKFIYNLVKTMFFMLWCISSFAIDATEEVAEEKIYKIATDVYFPPFEYENKDGKFVGIDVDLLEALAKEQNFKYELLPLGFKSSMDALERGEVDAIFSGMSITEARKEVYDFSEPYLATGLALVVEENSPIASYEDLEGRTVTVKRGTSGCEFVEKISQKYDFNVLYLDDDMNLVEDVALKLSDACFEDIIFIEYNIANGLKVKTPVGEEDYSECAVMVKKGENKELIEKINNGLMTLKNNGTYNKIIDKYLK